MQYDEDQGLIAAHRLDGRGGSTRLGWTEVERVREPGFLEDGLVWVHLNRRVQRAQHWLTGRCGIPQHAAEALLEEDTRPRATVTADGLLVNLRGVNLNPGAEPDDMLSVRMWFSERLIVTARARPLRAMSMLDRAIRDGHGPLDQGDFLVKVAELLTQNLYPVVEDIEQRLEALEAKDVKRMDADPRAQLAELRREATTIRRFISAQREAFGNLMRADVAWLADVHRRDLGDDHDQVTRLVEELDLIRERAIILRDEWQAAEAERMGRTSYILTVVAAVFLPLTFIAGLLGINVGGIPGADSPWAFWGVSGVLLLVGLVELWVFRRLKWI